MWKLRALLDYLQLKDNLDIIQKVVQSRIRIFTKSGKQRKSQGSEKHKLSLQWASKAQSFRCDTLKSLLSET